MPQTSGHPPARPTSPPTAVRSTIASVADFPPQPPHGSENLAKLRELLNQPLRVTISDGRTFAGYFLCVDKQRNVILGGTEESKGPETRSVGMVMIPGAHLVKVEVQGESAYT